MKIDLHCHSMFSDGSSTVEELVGIAKARGVDVVALTDHDTMAGTSRAVAVGNREGVRVIPGVEISAMDVKRGRRAHILCYAPKRSPRLEELLSNISENRRKAMLISIQKVLRIYPLPEEMILDKAKGSTNFFKQHVMRALMDAGYTNEVFGEVFQKLFSSKSGLAYEPVEYPDVYQVLDVVRDAGGIAVLAHPSEYNSMDLFQELCEKKRIQGAEAFHPRNLPADTEKIQEICENFGLAVTGGTDFHGFYTRICNPPGSYLTDEAQFDKFRMNSV